jgi:protease II
MGKFLTKMNTFNDFCDCNLESRNPQTPNPESHKPETSNSGTHKPGTPNHENLQT